MVNTRIKNINNDIFSDCTYPKAENYTKADKTVQRYVEKLKELQQSKELIKENEKVIEELEEELEEATISLNAVFADQVDGDLFTDDTNISSEICKELLAEMKNNEK